MIVCLSLAGLCVSWRVASQNAPAAPAPMPAKPTPTASGTSADNDAAARHAKRTACIKEARARKLVGARKTAYIKDCAASP